MKITMTIVRFSVLVITLFAMSAAVAAQATTGNITGAVMDSAGNVVPGATVTLSNPKTGLTRSTTSDSSGNYTISEIFPGTYSLTVEAASFSKTVVKDVELNVGTRRTENVQLNPGPVTEIVEVAASGNVVETTRSELAGVVTPREIQSLPLLNRTFSNLAIVMPEARPVGNFDPTKARIGTFAMSGGDGRQVDVNVDGGSNKDNVVGSLVQNFSYESIQEFQVIQHRWSAEAGRSVGGIINAITKSGSNVLHGSAFGNFRHDSLLAKDFFQRRDNRAKPPFERQEFGGSFSGRIVRDKLFFFTAFEKFRERQQLALTTSQINQINAIPGVTASETIPTPYDDTLFTVKVDHNLTDKQRLAYRLAYQQNSSPNDQVSSTRPSDINGGNTSTNKSYSFVANHTYTIKPSVLNQFTFHYQNFANNILGITDKTNILFPSVQSGANGNVPQQTLKGKYQFRNDTTITSGSHILKFGTDYIFTDLGGFFNFGGVKGYQIDFFEDPLTIRARPLGFATPGIVRAIRFFDGHGATDQTFHQLAFYFQDDIKVTSRMTLNLGVRWDANIGILPDQTNNRTIQILKNINHPLARGITGDPSKLSKGTTSFTEFQPRVGFAWDPFGDGKTVIRGGYGIFYDQLFQNLTLFSLQQSNATIFQQVLGLTNTAIGVGDLATFRFGVDPLPPVPPGTTTTQLATGSFGRINDPNNKNPYVQKWSLGFQRNIGKDFVLSSDYVHTLGINEPRVHVINPQIRSICDPAFPGSTPTSTLCTRGVSSRLLDRAFLDAGMPNNRLNQINMIGTTNRSFFDSWTTTLKYYSRKMMYSASYVLSSSRAWGGQPTASYSGNGIAIDPANQFKPEEFGPTRIDERHRFVLSGNFELPFGFSASPIVQLASSRPYSLNRGFDLDGDGLATVDRICASASPLAVFNARGNSAALAALNPVGCTQMAVNSQRGGFIVDSSGNPQVVSGRYFNVDLRLAKSFAIGDRVKIKGYADFINLFDVDNFSFSDRLGLSLATAAATFMQPASLFGPGFGPSVGRPLTMQLGLRMDF